MRLSEITGVKLVELDKVFWGPELAATPREQWIKLQQELTTEKEWILDGDLGPYDAVEVRLQSADTIIFLEPPARAMRLASAPAFTETCRFLVLAASLPSEKCSLAHEVDRSALSSRPATRIAYTGRSQRILVGDRSQSVGLTVISRKYSVHNQLCFGPHVHFAVDHRGGRELHIRSKRISRSVLIAVVELVGNIICVIGVKYGF